MVASPPGAGEARGAEGDSIYAVPYFIKYLKNGDSQVKIQKSITTLQSSLYSFYKYYILRVYKNDCKNRLLPSKKQTF